MARLIGQRSRETWLRARRISEGGVGEDSSLACMTCERASRGDFDDESCTVGGNASVEFLVRWTTMVTVRGFAGQLQLANAPCAAAG
jgi:hypothetical protein